ncbi:hypothetical protein [Bacteroides sp.]
MESNLEELPYQALIKGYILMPKQYFEDHLFNATEPMTKVEAFITLLIKVNYQETTCTLKGIRFTCHRGESLCSYQKWAEIFRWSKSKTARFFKELAEVEKVIELLPCQGLTTRLRIINYNQWTGCRYEARQREKEKADERFEEFWRLYHRITRMPKQNRGKAEREWRKMAPEQQELAINGIKKYYLGLKDIEYCKQAGTYLADKSYMNE